MAELADAIDLGSIGNTVQVQVLLPALFFIILMAVFVFIEQI
jgi:hypothetical protein